MTPIFLLQLVDARTGRVVTFPGGGPIERDLLTDATDRIVSKGVGIFRTEAQVRRAVEAGLREAFYEFKKESIKAL